MCPALQPPIQLFFQDLSVDISAAFIRLSQRAPRLLTVGRIFLGGGRLTEQTADCEETSPTSLLVQVSFGWRH